MKNVKKKKNEKCERKILSSASIVNDTYNFIDVPFHFTQKEKIKEGNNNNKTHQSTEFTTKSQFSHANKHFEHAQK